MLCSIPCIRTRIAKHRDTNKLTINATTESPDCVPGETHVRHERQGPPSWLPASCSNRIDDSSSLQFPTHSLPPLLSSFLPYSSSSFSFTLPPFLSSSDLTDPQSWLQILVLTSCRVEHPMIVARPSNKWLVA